MRQTRDLARVGWRGLAPFLPIGPRERPRLADSFFAPGSGARGIPRVARPAIRRVAAMRGKERGPRGTPPSGPLRGGKGIAGSPRAPQFGPPEGGRGARGWGDWGGGEGSRFRGSNTCLSGRGLAPSAHHRSESCLTSSPPPSGQRVGSEWVNRAQQQQQQQRPQQHEYRRSSSSSHLASCGV